jgi:hypothetical protein
LPENVVVVCEAGCASGGAEVVYAARREAGRAPPTANAGEAPALAARCVAGCYGKN